MALKVICTASGWTCEAFIIYPILSEGYKFFAVEFFGAFLRIVSGDPLGSLFFPLLLVVGGGSSSGRSCAGFDAGRAELYTRYQLTKSTRSGSNPSINGLYHFQTNAEISITRNSRRKILMSSGQKLYPSSTIEKCLPRKIIFLSLRKNFEQQNQLFVLQIWIISAPIP